jgi:integrase
MQSPATMPVPTGGSYAVDVRDSATRATSTALAPITIASAASAWVLHLQTRKRNPARPATIATLKSFINHHIVPRLGHLPVESVTNAALRDFVAYLAAQDLAPKSINDIASAVKSIVASVVDAATGDCLYPRIWNPEFIDAPTIGKQHQPIVTTQELERALSVAGAQDRALWALAAGTGCRIGELLALRIGHSETSSSWNATDATVRIETSMYEGQEQAPKTENSPRTIEIAPSLNDFMKAFVGSRSRGFLFDDGDGGPANVSTVRSHLVALLPGIGFHAFRRFRVTTLRAARCERQVEAYWIGHSSGQTMTDKYSKLCHDAAFRRSECDRIGLGFALPGQAGRT